MLAGLLAAAIIEIIWPKISVSRVVLLGDFSIKTLLSFLINSCSITNKFDLQMLVRNDIFARRWCAVVLKKFPSILTWLLRNPLILRHD